MFGAGDEESPALLSFALTGLTDDLHHTAHAVGYFLPPRWGWPSNYAARDQSMSASGLLPFTPPGLARFLRLPLIGRPVL